MCPLWGELGSYFKKKGLLLVILETRSEAEQSWSRKKRWRKKAKDVQKDLDKSPGKGLLCRVLFLYIELCIFCTAYSMRDCFGNASAKSVPICFSCWTALESEWSLILRKAMLTLPRFKYNVNGNWLFWWISALRNVGLGWLARADKGLLGIFHLINIFHLLVIYYTGNRVISPPPCPCCCFFQPTANGQPYEKSNNINPEICLYLSLYPNINPEEQSKRRERVPLEGV